MTTPAQPTPAPADQSARDFFQQDDAALASALNIDMGGETAEDAEQVANPDDDTPAAAAPVIPEVVTPKEEGVVELKPVEPDRKLMTEFAVMDEQGDLEIPDIKIRFKAKGESRELPLDHVVRLAQFGFANEEREQQVIAARKFVAESQAQQETLASSVQQYESYYERLFNDPAFYEEARLVFLSQNTPESRAVRAEQALAQERQSKVQQQEDNTIAAYVQQQLVPTVEKLLTENPLVSEYEVMGRHQELIAPFLVRGRVPVSRLPQVQQVVQSDLVDWTQRRQFERSLDKQKTTAEATKTAAAATAQVASAKRQASRVFAHHGTPAGDAPVKPVKYNSANDWLKSTFGSQDD